MKEKITIEKIDKYYKYFYLIMTTLAIYIMTILLKDMFYNLFNLSINNLTKIEHTIINITYQIFAITLSINFYIKNKNQEINTFKSYLKECTTALLSIIIYSLIPILELLILYYARVNISNMSILAKTIYLISFETAIIGILGIINRKTLEKNLKDIKINFRKYIDENIKYYILALLVMMISNLLILAIYPSTSGNQEAIINTLEKAPIYMIFSAVIFAPIVEELIFRLSIKRIIKDNLTFIITSGLIFGGMHVVGNINNFYDVLYIIPYSAPGIAFAYILSKTDNIFVPMSIHFMHNAIMMLFQIIFIFIF